MEANKPVEENRHHNIPVSRGGADGCNALEIDENFHSKFHSIFGHPTPDEFLRRTIIAGTLEGLPVNVLKEFTSQIYAPDWRELYDQHALVRLNGHTQPVGPEYQQKLHALMHDVTAMIADVRQFIERKFGESSGNVERRHKKKIRNKTARIAAPLAELQTLCFTMLAEQNGHAHAGRTATHTVVNLSQEALESVRMMGVLLGEDIPEPAQRFRERILDLFSADSSAEAARNALNKQNGDRRFLLTNPLLPHFRFLADRRLKNMRPKEELKPLSLTLKKRRHHLQALSGHIQRLLSSITIQQTAIGTPNGNGEH